MLAALRGLVRALERAAAVVVVTLLVAMLVLVVSQIVDRYVHPIWHGLPADEYVKVALIWMTFLGFGLAMRAGVEVRVDVIDKHVPARVRGIVYGAFDLVMLAMLGVILWKSVQLYRISTLQTILGTDLTVAVPVLGMLLGCALMALALLARVLRRAFDIEL
jgi:TRAP-type C4-dicarboxylate transport system permease small subunit